MKYGQKSLIYPIQALNPVVNFITNAHSLCVYNSVDPDQLASLEASWSESTMFSNEDVAFCAQVLFTVCYDWKQ